MIKRIEIDEKTVEINSSAGWLYVYRNRFGHDILPDLMPIVESILAALASVIEETGGEINEKTFMTAVNNDSVVDAFIKMAGMEVVTVFNIFWAMAYNADKTIKGPEDYFNEFDRFPVDEIVPELLRVIIDSSVSTKNAERLLNAMKSLTQSD